MQRASITSRERATRLTRLAHTPPGRILHLENDAFVAALVEATLEDPGFEVHWVSTRESALTAAGTNAYDAYLLGVGALGMSGDLLVEELARLDNRVPIILIGNSRDDSRLRLNLTVVTRPFAPRALIGAVEAALDACPAAA